MPKQTHAKLRHLEFLPLPDKRILAIMVTNEKDVQNKVLHVDREYSADELQHAANYLNQQFTGQDVHAIRANLLKDLDRSRQDVDTVMKTAVEVADKALFDENSIEPEYIVQGETNLVRYSGKLPTGCNYSICLKYLTESVKCWAYLIAVSIVKG